jgi:hypothetical protein
MMQDLVAHTYAHQATATSWCRQDLSAHSGPVVRGAASQSMMVVIFAVTSVGPMTVEGAGLAPVPLRVRRGTRGTWLARALFPHAPPAPPSSTGIVTTPLVRSLPGG